MQRPNHVNGESRTHAKSLALLLIAPIVLFTGVRMASATEAQLVKIEPVVKNGKLESIKLSPDTIAVPKGTIVVWLSGVERKMVKLVFNDPAACQDVTADPKLRKFYTQWYDCYTTTYLPFAQTTSLEFSQVGTYPYTVQTEDGKTVAKGNLIVMAR